MNMLENNFYGDNFRWFIARVIDNMDPDRLGRVQVQIRGIHSTDQQEILQSSLPWASTVLPTTEGGTSGIGKIPKLLPGALVFGIFLDGKTSQLPLVIGHLNQEESPTLQQKRRGALNQNSPNLNLGANSGVDGAIIRNDVKNLDLDDNNTYIIAQRRLGAMIFFTDNGYTPAQAAGIVGNLEGESNFNTTVVSTFDNESSQGIAQWNPDVGRLQELKEFAANRLSSDWRKFSVQLQFVKYELENYSYFQNALLKNATKFTGGKDNKNATWIFLRYYENPLITPTLIKKREGFATTAYNQFTDNYITSAGAG
jgi:hypothetical protein